MADSMASDGW